MKAYMFSILSIVIFMVFTNCGSEKENKNLKVSEDGSWVLETVENPFDGKINIAYLEAENSEKATLVINYHEKSSKYSLFFGGIGNSRCENKKVRFAFDEEKDTYSARAITNDFESEWFIYSPLDRFQISSSNDYLSKEEVLLFFTYHSKVLTRFQSECGIEDYVFNIKGAEKIINKVIGDEIDLDRIAKKLEEKNLREKSFELLYTGGVFETVLLTNGYVRDEPKYSAIVNNNRYEKGAKIKIKECTPNPSYCKVVTYRNEEIPGNSTYYVHIDALDLTQLSAVD